MHFEGARRSSLARVACAALLLAMGACANDGLLPVPLDLSVQPDFADPCAPLVTCGGRCVDVQGDANHCGACGVACGDAPCTGGVCRAFPRTHATYTPTTFPVGGVGPVELALGDVDGDGKLDVVTANEGSHDVSLLKNLGDGSLGPAVTTATSVDQPRGLVLADFDEREPTPDVAVLAAVGRVQLLVSRGGTVYRTASMTTGTDPLGLAAADMNGDGFVDLVVSSRGSARLEVHQGNGGGDFDLTGPTLLRLPAMAAPGALAVGDFERDGMPDIVTMLGDGPTLYTLHGRGSGVFMAPEPIGTIVNPVHNGLMVVDVNDDEALDVIGGATSSVAYLYGRGVDMNGAVSFSLPIFQRPPGHNFDLDGLAMGKLRGDTLNDLVTASEKERAVRVFFGNSWISPVFSQPDVYAVPGPRVVALGDLNGDGVLDIVAANPGDNSVTVLLDTTL